MKADEIKIWRMSPTVVLRVLTLVVMMILVVACAQKTRFPISAVTPAADIVAVRSEDSNGNRMLRITAKNLAAVDRIATPNKAYVVWIVTERDGARNVGKLINHNSKTARLETLIPNYTTEVFITAEEDGEAVIATGIEISRIVFKK